MKWNEMKWNEMKWNEWCRQDMVEARVRRLPGYVERVELTRQKGPAYRLRQYASRVLGDMQLPDQVLRTARCWAHSVYLKD